MFPKRLARATVPLICNAAAGIIKIALAAVLALEMKRFPPQLLQLTGIHLVTLVVGDLEQRGQQAITARWQRTRERSEEF